MPAAASRAGELPAVYRMWVHTFDFSEAELVLSAPLLEKLRLSPGDLVEIRTGDLVPADCRVFRLKTGALSLSQAGLTGESVSVAKTADAIEDHSVDCELQAKDCIVFSSTAVSQGAATCVVTETGMRTEIGKIQAQITEAADETEDTPLKQKLDDFGDQLTWFIGIICLLVWVMNYQFFVSWTWGGLARPFHFSDFTFDFSQCTYYFKIAVALAVAAIPEGLPAVITTCLALGTRKMAKKNAIVRHLQSVETLGCTSVICSDKTGTLTTNQMVVVAMAYPDKSASKLAEHKVEGTSYTPVGSVVGLPKVLSAGVLELAKVCALCNQVVIRYVDGKYERVGEPTEAALKVLVEKIGLPGKAKPTDPSLMCKQARATAPHTEEPQHAMPCHSTASDPISHTPHSPHPQANDYWNDAYPRNAVLEFSRDRKSMSTLCGLSAAGGGDGGGGGKSPARGRSPAKSPARSKSPAKAKSPARAKSPAKKTTGGATDANMLYVKGTHWDARLGRDASHARRHSSHLALPPLCRRARVGGGALQLRPPRGRHEGGDVREGSTLGAHHVTPQTSPRDPAFPHLRWRCPRRTAPPSSRRWRRWRRVRCASLLWRSRRTSGRSRPTTGRRTRRRNC